MDIKVRQGGPAPATAVVVATVRGLRWHGGVAREDLESPNVDAVQVGAQNLANAIRIVKMYGLPVVVAINRFPTDNRAEVEAAAAAAHDAGAAVAEADGFAKGGAGMTDLAAAVWRGRPRRGFAAEPAVPGRGDPGGQGRSLGQGHLPSRVGGVGAAHTG